MQRQSINIRFIANLYAQLQENGQSCEVEIAGERFKYFLFRFELPDPERILFGQAPYEFTLFPNLPVELRLRIWRFGFPGPRVVNISYAENVAALSYNDANNKRGICEFPVTLYICSESRKETLKHYFVFHRRPYVHSDYFDLRPLCIHPSRDHAVLFFDHWSGEVFHTIYIYEWFNRMHAKSPQFFKKLLSLEIRDTSLEPSQYGKFEDNYDKPDDGSLYGGSLLWFEALREVTFTRSYCDDNNLDEGSAEARQEYADVVTEFLEDNGNAFEGCRIPKVVVREWEPLPDFHKYAF